MFNGYYYDYKIKQLTQNQAVIDSGITEAIQQTINRQETASQQQEPTGMATSSSSATITGIYSMSQLPQPKL